MVMRDAGNGFFAVPYDAVTVNGHYLPKLNVSVEPYSGPWAMLSQEKRKALDGETGRSHRYRNFDECTEDAEVLARLGDHSVCP